MQAELRSFGQGFELKPYYIYIVRRKRVEGTCIQGISVSNELHVHIRLQECEDKC